MQTIQIELERTVFVPGEVVRGHVFIQNREEATCKSVDVRIEGRGHCHWTEGSDDNKRSFRHTVDYMTLRRTLLGSATQSPVILQAGKNPVFGPPWNPEECVLYIPMSHQQSFLIIRIETSRKKVLGAVSVNVGTLTAGEEVTLKLQGNSPGGKISVSMSWMSGDQENAILRLQVHKVTDLSFGIFDSYDVCVQAYPLPMDTPLVSGSAIPDPAASLVLPVGQIVLPFEFQLPQDLPSSFQYVDSYVCYSVYANIESYWKYEVAHRVFFSVQQPTAAATMMAPLYKSITNEIYPQCCIPPFCAANCNIPLVCLGSYGNLVVDVYLDRTAYAPGETMRLSCRIQSGWSEAPQNLRMSAKLVQQVRRCAQGHTSLISHVLGQPTSIRNLNEPTFIKVPPVPPTYLGNLTQNPTWYGQVAQYKGRWERMEPEPCAWQYTLSVTVELNAPGIAISPMTKIMHLPVVICGMGLNVLPSIGRISATTTAPTRVEAPEQSKVLIANSPPDFDKSQVTFPDNLKMPGVSQPYPIASTTEIELINNDVCLSAAPATSAPVSAQTMIRSHEYSPVTVVPDPLVDPVTGDHPTLQQSSDLQYIPDWKMYPEIKAALPHLVVCPVVAAAEPERRSSSIRQIPEDRSLSNASLMYRRMYFSS